MTKLNLKFVKLLFIELSLHFAVVLLVLLFVFGHDGVPLFPLNPRPR
jgi:hypothetical protein